MSQIGQVIKINEDTVMVRIKRSEACGKCGGCAHGLQSTEMDIEAVNLCNAQIEDWVNVDLHHQDFFKAAGIMYGLPLIAFLIGIAVGYGVAGNIGLEVYQEPIAFGMGFLAMALTYVYIRHKESYWRTKVERPVATAIMQNQE